MFVSASLVVRQLPGSPRAAILDSHDYGHDRWLRPSPAYKTHVTRAARQRPVYFKGVARLSFINFDDIKAEDIKEVAETARA